jgi:hypothetical protein
MSRFQLVWHGEHVVAGSIVLDGWLYAERHGKQDIVGILTLAEDEWTELAQLCRQCGIPVVCDRPRKE